jgi:hypothetical protein
MMGGWVNEPAVIKCTIQGDAFLKQVGGRMAAAFCFRSTCSTTQNESQRADTQQLTRLQLVTVVIVVADAQKKKKKK